jgi:uncharacterized protein YfaT (DUF1175 family)
VTPRPCWTRRSLVLALAAGLGHARRARAAPWSAGPLKLADDTDREAFRAWFVLLADAQFESPAPEVVDCAALVRYAYREALRRHTPEWYRRNHLPGVALADVRSITGPTSSGWPLFRVATAPNRFAEFADAATLVRLNARLVGRQVAAARPGDLLYFHQDGARSPDHLMVFVGPSRFDRRGRDWIVYHTGPDEGRAGEVRKVTAADLERHPLARWRPIRQNPAFAGVFRLAILEAR